MHLLSCIPPDSRGSGGRCLCKHAPAGLIGSLLGTVVRTAREPNSKECGEALADIVEYVSNLRAQCSGFRTKSGE